MKVNPLSLAAKPPETTYLDMSSTAYRAAPAFDAHYFELVNMVVQEEPANEYDKTMLGIASYIGPRPPAGLESNWIETIPDSEIFIGLRTYGPEKSVLEAPFPTVYCTFSKSVSCQDLSKKASVGL